jgi:hypothetical protein
MGLRQLERVAAAFFIWNSSGQSKVVMPGLVPGIHVFL